MEYRRFVRLRSPLWDRFEAALAEAGGRHRPDHDALEEMAFRYRQVLHDHALARVRYPGTGAARRLQRLALEGTRLLTREAGEGRGGLLHFFRRTFPAAFRRQLPLLGVVAAAFFALALFGLAVTIFQPGLGALFVGPQAVAGLEQGRLWTESLTTTVPGVVTSSAIATNNLSVALTAWAGGATAGLLSLWIVFLNGLLLGSVVGLTLHYSLAGALFAFVAAHGPLEITVILCSAAGGLVLARGLVAAEDRPRAEVLKEAAGEALVILGGCLPWLVVLALVEAFVSPDPRIAPALKAVLGLSLEVLFFAVALNPAGRSHG
jgi:uncharacterized membrane protein SpoIIM required for sporulation